MIKLRLQETHRESASSEVLRSARKGLPFVMNTAVQKLASLVLLSFSRKEIDLSFWISELQAKVWSLSS